MPKAQAKHKEILPKRGELGRDKAAREKHNSPHSTVKLTPLGTHSAEEAAKLQGSPPAPHAFSRVLGVERRGLTGGTRRHLLLIVQLAVELLVAVEAGGLQGLLAGRTLDALLVPQAVVEAQQEPVRNNALAPFTHRLGGRGSAYRKDPGAGVGGGRGGRGDGPREGRTEDRAAPASPVQAGGSGGGRECAGRRSGIRGGPEPYSSSGSGSSSPISFLLER